MSAPLLRTIQLATLAVVVFAAGCRPQSAPPQAAKPTVVAVQARPTLPIAPTKLRDASDDLFEQHQIPTLRIELSESQAQSLRDDARNYVRAKLIENDATTYAAVAIKLKGAAGSFQGLDDGKPGFTLNMSKFQERQRFHALDKFHLNNSVQDETYLCEGLCGELCREAGVPAARVSHARVWLNDRDLGLYVLKEGFDRGFLSRHFVHPRGNLYDGGFCQDIDAELEKDSGKGPNDLSDLKSLVAACNEPDPEQRWSQTAARLDIDAFINFMALELMTCHWDGYTYNKNNYRVYFDPATGLARFLPHGMDQMFQDPGFPLLAWPEPVVSRSVMQNPVWRKRYRQRVEELLPLFSAESLTAKVDAFDRPLPAAFRAINEEAVQHHVEAVRQLKERLVARAANLREQITQPDPDPAAPPASESSPLEFNEHGIAELAELYPHVNGDARLEPQEVDGTRQFLIEAGESQQCLASWRYRVLLEPGKYRFEAKLRTTGVIPLDDDRGRGAGLRISGANRENQLSGDSEWTSVTYDFQVSEQLGVELVAELRAIEGQLWIQSPVRLVKLNAE